MEERKEDSWPLSCDTYIILNLKHFPRPVFICLSLRSSPLGKMNYDLLVSRIGISATPRVTATLTSSILSFHCSLVSPFTSSGSTFHPRNNSVRNATDSVIPNFLPRHALGPAQHDLSMMRRLHENTILTNTEGCEHFRVGRYPVPPRRLEFSRFVKVARVIFCQSFFEGEKTSDIFECTHGGQSHQS